MDPTQLAAAVSNYQPNQQVLDGMQKLNILAVVGPTASGKSSVVDAIVKLSSDVGLVLDETSRAPRPDDQQGVDFLFRSQAEIIDDMQKGELVQVAIGPNGDLYCTRLSSFPKGTGVIPLVPAAVEEFRRLPVESFNAAFIVPANFEQWQEWFNAKSTRSQWTQEQVNGRLAEAKKSYEFALADKEIYFVLNDQIESAAKRLLQIVNGQSPDDEDKARQIAESNLAKL